MREKSNKSFFKPMLCADYKDQYARIIEDESDKFVLQPKLDGVRAFMDHTGFYTRSSLLIPSYHSFWTKWREACDYLEEYLWFDTLTLDGELYRHGLPCDEISADVRRSSDPVSGLKFHIFDVYSLANKSQSTSFKARRSSLEGIFHAMQRTLFGECIELVPNYPATEQAYQECLNSGYEGAVYRKISSMYKPNSRGLSMVKRKALDDTEARVIDIIPCEKYGSKMAGVLKCVSNDGIEVNCQATGDLDSRISMLENREAYVDSHITFVYNGKTSKGNYRHARFLRMCTK